MKTFDLRSSEDLVTEKALTRLTKIPKNSILMVVRSGILARTLPVAINRIPVTVNQDMRAFVPEKAVEPKFIAWQLIANEREILSDCSKDGTTVASIEGPALSAFPLKIAPGPEQTRIVQKLEELLSDLDAGVAELKAAQRKLAQYRQSLLKAAVEGALTAEWRGRNTSASGELPEGWKYVTLGDVADWSSGGTPSRSNPSFFLGAIPWIKTGELGPQVISTTEEHISEEAIASSSAKVFPKGAIALAMYGATIGKASILGVDAATNQACAVGVSKSVICTRFLYYFLLSQAKAFAAAGKGGAQPNISQGIVKSWPLQLPPLVEQREIVAVLEAQLEAVKQQQAALEKGLTQAAAQRKNIFKAAFAGQLVPQDPSDEPASELLARIRAERSSNGSNVPRRRRKTA